MNEKIIIGTDALDALESQFGYAIGIDERDYILLQNPIHTELLPEHMVGALAIPVLENSNIPQGEPVILLWRDMFCAYNAGNGNPLCKGIVLPVGQIITKDVEKTLLRMMWPKDIDHEKLSIRRTEIQAILENDLFETSEDEQMLVYEAEHIDLLLEENQPKQEGKKSPYFELTPESAKPDDKVYAVVQEHKLNKLGRRYKTNTFVAVELTLSEIRVSAAGTTVSGFYEENIDGYAKPITFSVENLSAEALFYDLEEAKTHANELNQDQEDEVLYLLNGTTLVHIQRSDDGFDYTLYNAQTLNLIDGGQYEGKEGSTMRDALETILFYHDLDQKWVKKLDPNVIQQNPLTPVEPSSKKSVRVRIYQIVSKRDNQRVIFESLEDLKKITGSAAPDKALYDLVFDGEISVTSGYSKADWLEELFRLFNADRKPNDYHGRSLCVSDIVELDGKLYYCDPVGFKKVSWKEKGGKNNGKNA